MAIFKDYKAGDTIVREGEKGNSLFIILEGSVKVFTKSKEGSPASLEPLGQGDFFGELAFLAHPYRQASVVASSACKILEIPESLLNPLLVKFPKVRTTLEEAQKTRDLRLTLARVPLFSDLNPEERLSIAKHLVLEEFLEGEVIFREGSQGGSLYIIQSGQVGISTTLMEDEEVSVIKKSAADQKELYLSTLEKGDFFGEASLLTNEPRSATATATAAKTELLKLSKIDLAEIVKQYPRIIPVLKKYHERRVQETLNALKSIL
jgi:cAMP-dependent protein kinase regulator